MSQNIRDHRGSTKSMWWGKGHPHAVHGKELFNPSNAENNATYEALTSAFG